MFSHLKYNSSIWVWWFIWKQSRIGIFFVVLSQNYKNLNLVSSSHLCSTICMNNCMYYFLPRANLRDVRVRPCPILRRHRGDDRWDQTIEEGWGQKPKQRSCVCLGGKIFSIPCRASCFVSVDLKETVEFNRFFQIDRMNFTTLLSSVVIKIVNSSHSV